MNSSINSSINSSTPESEPKQSVATGVASEVASIARRMPQIGDVATESRLITAEVIEEFARVSGDVNPIHLDPAYAAKSRFGQRVAHGMMAAVMLTKVAGTQLPGPGSIYLSQTMKFKKPVLIGDVITAEIKIIGQKAGKPLYTLSTIVRNQDGVVLLDGEAMVFYEPVDI